MAIQQYGTEQRPKIAPIGLEMGDHIKSPWDGTLEVLDERGTRSRESEGENDTPAEDTREWKVCDTHTGEETWVDFDFLLLIMQGNLTEPWQPEDQ